MKKYLSGLFLSLLLTSGSALAGQRDMIDSCYSLLNLKMPESALKLEIFVLIDQTTPLPAEQETSLINGVLQKLVPETAVTVITFSAFIGDRYAQVVFSGALDAVPTPDERDNMPKKHLRTLDACLIAQRSYAGERVASAMQNSFGESTDQIARSDILSSLENISINVVSPSPAYHKNVLLISDMLENSSLTSFYERNAVRQVDVDKELEKVAKFGKFAGATVYVAGAGMIVTKGRNQIETYRDPKTMAALESFWTAYFQQSEAKIEIFGKPSLMGRF